MKLETILTIRLGGNAVYLVPGRQGYLLVDGGHRVFDRWFFTRLKLAGITLDQIRLAVVTHVHFDHVGTLAAVKNRYGCQVAVHAREAGLLASGKVVIPPGTNGLGRGIKRFTEKYPGATAGFCAFPPVEPDIRITNEMPLEKLGFNARIIPTPGHTEGSLSVLTGEGNAFVGDIAVNMPLLASPRYASPFGYSAKEMVTSLRYLIDEGAKWIYPAHGKPFAASEWMKTSLGVT